MVTKEKQIRVLIVEDEVIVAEALCALLDDQQHISVVGRASNAREAVQKARQLDPDLILLDLRLPDQLGIWVITELAQSRAKAKILVLSGHAENKEVVAAFKAGAIGYVLKTQAATEIVQAIDSAMADHSTMHPTVAQLMIDQLGQQKSETKTDNLLTATELCVLTGVAQGLRNKEIAHSLAISRVTVSIHISRILHKLCLENRTQAALYALKRGFVPLEVQPSHRLNTTAVPSEVNSP